MAPHTIPIVGIFFLFTSYIFGQGNTSNSTQEKWSPYELKLGEELLYLGTGVLGRWGGETIIENLDPFTEADLALLDPNNVNAFDRSATRQYSLGARTASDVIRNGSYLFPFFLFIDKKARKNWAQVAVISGEALLINSAVNVLSKGLFARARPLAYNEAIPLEERTTVNAKLSFISGHSSGTAVMSFVTAKLFADFNPDSPLRPYIWGGAGALTLATGYFRYKGGKHFFSDVIIGGTVGALIGIYVPQLHKKKAVAGEPSLGFVSDSGQVGLVLRW